MRRFILITSVAAIAMLGFASTSSVAEAAVAHHVKSQHNANVHHVAAKKKVAAKKAAKPAKKTRKAEATQSSVG
jgi:hypothetical protein